MSARCCASALIGIAWAVASVPSLAGAQGASPPHVEAPPPPSERAPELWAHVRLGSVIPLERSDICPGDSICVLGAGAAVGVEVERRWPVGLGVSLAYDAWFVDSGGVFELGAAQIVRAMVKYAFGQAWAVHPTVHLGGGALVFGDTLRISTVGGAVDLGVTLEIELTASVMLTFAAQGWVFTTSPFTTTRDRTSRSEGLGINATLQLNVGLAILADAGPP